MAVRWAAPIIHDKLFFFGDYQGVKQSIGVTRHLDDPDADAAAGDLYGRLEDLRPYDDADQWAGSLCAQEFPNDVINIPFDPAAKSLLARFPTPTSTAAANNYTRTANDSDHQNQFDFRVDGALGTRDRAFGRYTYYNEVEQPVTPLPDGSGAITGSVIGTGSVAGLSNVLGQQAVFERDTYFFSRGW